MLYFDWPIPVKVSRKIGWFLFHQSPSKFFWNLIKVFFGSLHNQNSRQNFDKGFFNQENIESVNVDFASSQTKQFGIDDFFYLRCEPWTDLRI